MALVQDVHMSVDPSDEPGDAPGPPPPGPPDTGCPPGQYFSGPEGRCVPNDYTGPAGGQQACVDGGGVWDSVDGVCRKLGAGGAPAGGTSTSGIEDWYKLFQGLGKGAGTPALPQGPQWDMSKDPIWLQLNEAVSSALAGNTTFDKDTIERMKGAARIRSENLRDSGVSKVKSNIISRGLQDSPVGAALEAEASRAADADYQATATQVEVQATIQNYKDRTGALDRAERLLNSKMTYVLALANNEIQRAEIALAYRRIDEARNALDKQLSAQLFGMQAGFDFQTEFFNLQLPLLLAQLNSGDE